MILKYTLNLKFKRIYTRILVVIICCKTYVKKNAILLGYNLQVIYI